MAVAALTGHGDPDVLRLLPAHVPGERVALAGLHAWTEDDIGNVARCFAGDRRGGRRLRCGSGLRALNRVSVLVVSRRYDCPSWLAQPP